MDILRIATAGSVDDGKSTLIGRLLYETNSITRDKIEALESASKRKGLDFLDLSLLTDGLIAEREQGITIDVANIYFSTPKRKYIIADTPGHFEYTRNMVTGASNTKVSMILVDARNGVLEQTFRHFFISSMLRIPKVIVCVNKMDLVGYSQERFNEIVTDFKRLADKVSFEGQEISFIPISSLYGQNITTQSEEITWYEGKPLLEELENIDIESMNVKLPARFPVQFVVRPKTEEFHDYRGYAGKISSGTFKTGDEITVLPTGQTSKIATIEKFGQKLQSAGAKESVVITLETDVDVSRGNMLVKTTSQLQPLKEIKARICWMDSQALTSGKNYILQHGINDSKSKIVSLNSKIDVVNQETSTEVSELKLNEIGEVTLKTAKPIFADKYEYNPSNGAFILVDEFSHSTVGVGFVL
ncbi:sulfate adenylyltransferase subunit 1 [Pseudarcicella hirudinis]|uniref:sulfate adenylyltransferase n=1 Tax=Pseudarcicella hirudinis TaxID=1079859 RepID=A0A1I5XR70_9BACT|nr:GTP-binding protein [Pseudarcicella hirudinis]SFQ34462.1 sulfate adenylyltransferase subunit 1 [Pseudarcicella hirudinis]